MEEVRVKQVITNRYDVSMYQMPNGFQVMYDSLETGLRVSELINDYHTAALLFDMKVRELEGH